ncbi:MAG: DUF4920 domain-containing protein [Saprospiraceae bacterium]
MKIYFISYLTIASVIIFSLSCKQQVENVSLNGSYGKAIDTVSAQTVATVISKIEGKDSIDYIVVKGKVSEVCQAKGCWINVISDADTTSQEIFVEFQDYAFVLPKDIAGASVYIQGKMFRDVTSVEELKQNAEDEGFTPADIAKISEPLIEISFMADGVKIVK